MPRAHRCFAPGHVWHLTHRCHQKAFLLKFSRDRARWRHWLFEAKQRYGLCVLNYIVTRNHIHLLVHDRGRGEITKSMHLVAGCLAQEYNRRKGRVGAFWQDRYHATAVQTESHLIRCLVYIDLNMVRAGVVQNPADWLHAGLHEIRTPPQRKAIVDRDALADLCGLSSALQLAAAHERWHDSSMSQAAQERDSDWTESVAVGTEDFVSLVRKQLHAAGLHREVQLRDGKAVLREAAPRYRFQPQKRPIKAPTGAKFSK